MVGMAVILIPNYNNLYDYSKRVFTRNLIIGITLVLGGVLLQFAMVHYFGISGIDPIAFPMFLAIFSWIGYLINPFLDIYRNFHKWNRMITKFVTVKPYRERYFIALSDITQHDDIQLNRRHLKFLDSIPSEELVPLIIKGYDNVLTHTFPNTGLEFESELEPLERPERGIRVTLSSFQNTAEEITHSIRTLLGSYPDENGLSSYEILRLINRHRYFTRILREELRDGPNHQSERSRSITRDMEDELLNIADDDLPTLENLFLDGNDVPPRSSRPRLKWGCTTDIYSVQAEFREELRSYELYNYVRKRLASTNLLDYFFTKNPKAQIIIAQIVIDQGVMNYSKIELVTKGTTPEPQLSFYEAILQEIQVNSHVVPDSKSKFDILL